MAGLALSAVVLGKADGSLPPQGRRRERVGGGDVSAGRCGKDGRVGLIRLPFLRERFTGVWVPASAGTTGRGFAAVAGFEGRVKGDW